MKGKNPNYKNDTWVTVITHVDIDSGEIIEKEKFKLNYKLIETQKDYERKKCRIIKLGRKQGEQLSIFD